MRITITYVRAITRSRALACFKIILFNINNREIFYRSTYIKIKEMSGLGKETVVLDEKFNDERHNFDLSAHNNAR